MDRLLALGERASERLASSTTAFSSSCSARKSPSRWMRCTTSAVTTVTTSGTTPMNSTTAVHFARSERRIERSRCYACFASRSRISASSFSCGGVAAGGASVRTLLYMRTTRNTTKPMMRNSVKDWMAAP